MDDDLTVEVMPEFDVDVQETAESLGEERGLNFDFITYTQEMLTVYTQRKVGENTWQKFQFTVPADLVCTQEELEELLNEKIDEMVGEA